MPGASDDSDKVTTMRTMRTSQSGTEPEGESVRVCCCEDPRRSVLERRCDACGIGKHKNCNRPRDIALSPYDPSIEGPERRNPQQRLCPPRPRRDPANSSAPSQNVATGMAEQGRVQEPLVSR